MSKSGIGMLAAAALFAPMLASAAVISGTWDFSSTFDGNTYSGAFSFTDLDLSQTYTNSTAAGFSVTTSFDTSGDGGNAFTYEPGALPALSIGGLADGVLTVSAFPVVNDWSLAINDFPALSPANLSYIPVGGIGSFAGFSGVTASVVPATAVPEPATLGLLGMGLLGLGLSRRGRVR